MLKKFHRKLKKNDLVNKKTKKKKKTKQNPKTKQNKTKQKRLNIFNVYSYIHNLISLRKDITL